jgi:HSP20 family molecular chaperone IbpA
VTIDQSDFTMDAKPRVSSRSSKKRKEVSKYNRPQITSEREPLVEVNVYDKEVKVVLEMPGLSKEHIKIQAYENSGKFLIYSSFNFLE